MKQNNNWKKAIKAALKQVQPDVDHNLCFYYNDLRTYGRRIKVRPGGWGACQDLSAKQLVQFQSILQDSFPEFDVTVKRHYAYSQICVHFKQQSEFPGSASSCMRRLREIEQCR